MIDSQTWDFFVDLPAGSRVPVLAKTSPTGKRFLTTSPDGTKANNLDALPEFPSPLAGIPPSFPLSIAGTSLVAKTSVQDVTYSYQPLGVVFDPVKPPRTVEHAGPFGSGNAEIPVPDVFWVDGVHTITITALLPYPATYTLTEAWQAGNEQNLERVLGDNNGRRSTLEEEQKGWWTWDLVLTRPDGSIDPTKPGRLTEVRITVHPSPGLTKNLVLTLGVRGLNPNCAAVAAVGLQFFTTPPLTRPPLPTHPLPDVVGLRLDKAFDALDFCHLSIYTPGAEMPSYGESTVLKQSIAPGTLVREYSSLTLTVGASSTSTSGIAQLAVTNESDRSKSLDLWLFDYTVGGWSSVGTVPFQGSLLVPLTDGHSQWLVAVDPSDKLCVTGMPDELHCVAWNEIGPRTGSSEGSTANVTIT